jgi:FMN-dependent NADH-azoreductase
MTAVKARFVPAEERSPEQRAAVELAGTLTDELLSSDAYLFAVPLYNWNSPASFQAWVDRIFTADALRAGGEEPLAGRHAVIVHSRGGGYGPGTPREGWDHSEPYLRRVLEDVWKLDVTVVTAELTLANTVPAMAHLAEAAENSLRSAHADAGDHARRVAELVAAGDPAVDLTEVRAAV